MSIHRYLSAALIPLAVIGTATAAPETRPADGKLKIFIFSGQPAAPARR